MRTKRREALEDITSPVHNGETWNSCPTCGRSWKDEVPTPGVIHRTRFCDNCDGTIRTQFNLNASK